jgi:hypothetical protein
VGAPRRNLFVASLGSAAIFTAAALAAATPVTPTRGARLPSAHPVFTWTLPPNERSKGIFIASKPDVTPKGKLYPKNLVADGLVSGDVREWAPDAPQWAGHYWWNVWSIDRNTLASYYSEPAEFTIPVGLTLRGVTTKRVQSRHSLSVVVRLTANVKRPLVRVRLIRGKSVVWRAAKRPDGSMFEVVKSSFRWQRPRGIRQGTRLTLVASISSGGIKRSFMRLARAP